MVRRTTVMWAIALLAIAASWTAVSCANNPSSAAAERIMRLTLQLKGPIDTTNGVRYYVVFNTATAADTTDVTSAESTASAGVVPAAGVQAGPRAYGPFLPDKPKIGFDLPFYLSGGATDSDPRRTINFTGTTPLLPVTWTDYFVLTSEFGTLQLIHGQRRNPLTNPTQILPNVGTLLKDQDFFINNNQLILLIRLSTLVNGSVYNPPTLASPAPGAAPVTVTPNGPGSIVTANFVTTNTQGQIIDRWTLADTEIGVTIGTLIRAQSQDQHFRPTVLNPAFIPRLVSDDSVNLSAFNSEIR